MGESVPNHELDEGGCTLTNGEFDGVEIEFEEDPGCPTVVVEDTGVVSDTVLVGLQGLRAGCNVRSWDHMEKILVRDKCCDRLQSIVEVRGCIDSRSWVSSNELSRGWVMSGKYGPNENSVMTCERFISVDPSVRCLSLELTLHTRMINVFTACIAMAKGRNVQVRY